MGEPGGLSIELAQKKETVCHHYRMKADLAAGVQSVCDLMSISLQSREL